MTRAANSFGPTVLNGGTPQALVLRTSVSALTAFDPESYAGCPRRWYFTRVAGVKEEQTVAQGMGTDIHEQLEHYEKTGENVLGPIAQAGKHLVPAPGSDLIVEAPFGDLAKAIELRKTRASTEEIERAAGLCAGSIPLDGYIDLRHARGEYIDQEGVLRKEAPEHGRVVEVVDHKSTSSIKDFSKSPGEMSETIQMVGYANYVANIVPGVDHIRQSHIYYQTRGAKLAKKVTSLISVRTARERWKRVHHLAVYMEEVARAPRVEDVEANTNSCSAYRGCPHVSRCPVTRKFGKGGSVMSLFNQSQQSKSNGTSGSLFGQKPPAPSAPAVSASAPSSAPKQSSLFGSLQKDNRAEVEASKQRLAAEDAVYGKCNACGQELNGANASKLPSGVVKHIGCPQAVVPSDAPQVTSANSAVPLKPEEIARIEDPEIRQRATEHAQAHAAQAPAQPATAEKKGGRCPASGTTVPITAKEAGLRKKVCPGCGVMRKVKDDEFTEDFTGWKIPGHNLPKVEAPQVAQAPAQVAPTSTTVQPVIQPSGLTTTVLSADDKALIRRVVDAAEGIVLYVDVFFSRGTRPQSLEDYYLPLVRDLEEAAGAADIRCAPNQSELSFGKWKGALSAYVRSKPPAPGAYVVRSSEIAEVVIEALEPMCATVVRPAR